MNKELYNVYVEHRKAGHRPKEAVTSARYELTQRAKVALRGWDFDVATVLGCATEVFRSICEVSGGRYIVAVYAAMDYDSAALEGVCETTQAGFAGLDIQPDQRVVSHEDGRYVLGDVVIQMEGQCLDTGYYRKNGMAKQPAFERCIEGQLHLLDWVEKCLNGDVYYVGLEVRIYEAGADTTGDDYVAGASLWGVEATPEYVGKVLNELFDEALNSLTS